MIQVDSLTYTYAAASEPAVRNLSFAIESGEIFGFLGPSGAGKSTTQKILIGLLQGFQGHVSVFGRPLPEWRSDYYERIGVSFEAPNHYLKLTARENLTYFRSLYAVETRDPQELLDMVGLGDDGEMLVSQYSKGMKNRLNVARAMLHHPELLFLDEPTAGLDPLSARRIKDVIRAEKEAGKTVFLTTHDMTVAGELCDRVAFIVDGEITRIDSPRALKLQYGKPAVSVEYRANGHNARQEFPLQGLGNNPAFLAMLREQDVQTIHTQEATLEDIFIQVTGRSLT
jgi:fluoroquinolone transport system ATP-binding protein